MSGDDIKMLITAFLLGATVTCWVWIAVLEWERWRR